MSFRINTNTASAFSSYQLQKGQQALSESLERLSTGKRINTASDDASGMVIANTLGSQARGYGQALRNSNDAIAITQVTDGALGNIDVSTDEGAQNANLVADAALEYIPRQRSQVGSNANQLKSSISNVSSAMINTISAKSEIEDVDFAEESMNLNKIKLLGKTQAFAQANTSAKKILDLFG